MRTDWNPVLRDELTKPYWAELQRFVREERARATVYPAPDEVFAALHLTPYARTRVLILGQDPYHGPGQAHGLCFSVRPGVAIPPSLHEAAAVEGASRARTFFRVTLPLLGPTTLFILVNAVINGFRLVDHIIVMTRGGPDNATQLLLTYIYEVGFRFWDTATASALTIVLLAILAASAAAQFLLLEKRTHYR